MLDLASINRATSDWYQGDFVLLEEIPEKLQFDMLALLTKDETEAPPGEELDWGHDPVEGFMIVSQTCDVARDWNGRDDRKWVVVSPLVKLREAQWKSVLKGKMPRFYVTGALARIGLALDLERAQTLSKATLAVLTPHRQSGCGTQDERRDLSQRLSEKLYRPALPDDFTSSDSGNEGAIYDLECYLEEGLKGGGDLHDFLDTVAEIRILPDSTDKLFPWDPPEVQVLFFFVLRAERVSGEDRERWDECAKDVVAHMVTSGRFRLLGTGYAVKTWSELSAAEYRSSDWLPLHR